MNAQYSHGQYHFVEQPVVRLRRCDTQAMLDLPQTHYAKAEGGNVAFQVVGDGPIDLIMVPGWFSHLDMQWDNPKWRAFIEELASFARVIRYDKRGTGLSDPVDGVPTIESRADDLLAVLDAAES